MLTKQWWQDSKNTGLLIALLAAGTFFTLTVFNGKELTRVTKELDEMKQLLDRSIIGVMHMETAADLQRNGFPNMYEIQEINIDTAQDMFMFKYTRRR